MTSISAAPRDPDTKWSVWGQREAIRALKRDVARGPSHAYVFAGPQGVGKRLAAMDFALSLVCEKPTGPGLYCGECSRCRRVDRAVLPDVTVFNLASQSANEKAGTSATSLTIATVRAIAGSLAYRPIEASYRVVIVDDIETMQETAQEAFLKTLEEPPSYAVIVLVTSDLDRLLPTIQSRCRIVRFSATGEPDIAERLQAGGADGDLAATVASLADGSMGWAIAALATPEVIASRSADVQAAEALIRSTPYDRAVGAVRLADDFPKNRDQVIARLNQLERSWRRRLLAGYGLVDIVEGEQPPDAVSSLAALNSVERCILDIQGNVRPRAALLTMVQSWPTIG